MRRRLALDAGQVWAEPSEQIPHRGCGGKDQTASRMTDLLEGRRADCLPHNGGKADASITLIGPDKRRYGCSSEKNVCKHGLLRPHHPLQMTMLVSTERSMPK
jgi:hypothetical protein